jgi:hypothetical protein
MEKEVVCISCGKKVIVKLISYGYGYIAICPECEKMAYVSNSKNINSGSAPENVNKASL